MKGTASFCIAACIITSAAAAQTAHLPPIEKGDFTVTLQPFVTGLNIPSDMADPHDGSNRLIVAETKGQLLLIENGQLQPTPFLQITTSDATNPFNFGLTGVRFHPGFANPSSPGFGKLYTVTAEPGGAGRPTAHFGAGSNHQSVVDEWQVDPLNPNQVDPATRREILRIDQPRQEHNVNQVAFGPDGLLYIAIGDGGNSIVDSHRAQDLDQILGKIIRIDVDDPSGNGRYSIPAGNPFVGEDGLDEIYAYGFRNPWRISFDRQTGDLYTGDVGQVDIEEVDRVVIGGNYGWNHKEGSFVYDPGASPHQGPNVTPDDGDPTLAEQLGLIDPIAEYDHTQGRSVTGGFVYRGSLIPQLEGKYIFGDLAHGASWTVGLGRLLYIDPDDPESGIHEFHLSTGGADLDFQLYSFAEDADGELYMIGRPPSGHSENSGLIMRIMPRLGDVNGDGMVTIADLGVLAANWQQSGRSWTHGDFNADGSVTIADLGILAAHWQDGVDGAGGLSFAEALAMFDAFNGVVIPEPSTLAMLSFGALLLRRQRVAPRFK